MTSPPPPPPPIEVTITPGCTPQAPVCVEIPQITASDGPETDAPPIRYEVRPVQIGGYEPGDEILGHPVPDEVLWAVWRWFDPADHRDAIRIAAAESGFDRRAVSRTNDVGLWQHHRPFIAARLAAAGLPADSDPTDIEVQAQITAWLVDQAGGWGPWATARMMGARR